MHTNGTVFCFLTAVSPLWFAALPTLPPLCVAVLCADPCVEMSVLPCVHIGVSCAQTPSPTPAAPSRLPRFVRPCVPRVLLFRAPRACVGPVCAVHVCVWLSGLPLPGVKSLWSPPPSPFILRVHTARMVCPLTTSLPGPVCALCLVSPCMLVLHTCASSPSPPSSPLFPPLPPSPAHAAPLT